jgi:hypothetical protein
MFYNPFTWIMLPIGIYAAVPQSIVLGNPPPVTRDDLGKLGRK